MSSMSTAPVVYWAESGSGATGGPTRWCMWPIRRLAASLSMRVMETDPDDPEYYVFGTDDTFIVGTATGIAVSFAQFMEVLNAANDSEDYRRSH